MKGLVHEDSTGLSSTITFAKYTRRRPSFTLDKDTHKLYDEI